MQFFQNTLKTLLFLTFIFPQDICHAQIPVDGLVGYYMLNGNAADSSSFENHGIISDNVTPTENRFGEPEMACHFGGGYIDAGSPDQFGFTDAITICVWIKPVAITDWSGIVSKWSGFGIGGFYLGINYISDAVRWNVDMPNPIEGNTIELNQWLHLVATFGENTIKIYENGMLINSDTYSGEIQNNMANLIIGGQYDFLSDYLFQGAIDDLLLYNRELSANEIQELYNFQSVSNIVNVNHQVNWAVYPNPTNGIIHIDIPETFDAQWYALYNTQGGMIKKRTFSENINLSDLPVGVYHLKVGNKETFLSRKVVVK